MCKFIWRIRCAVQRCSDLIQAKYAVSDTWNAYIYLRIIREILADWQIQMIDICQWFSALAKLLNPRGKLNYSWFRSGKNRAHAEFLHLTIFWRRTELMEKLRRDRDVGLQRPDWKLDEHLYRFIRGRRDDIRQAFHIVRVITLHTCCICIRLVGLWQSRIGAYGRIYVHMRHVAASLWIMSLYES